MKSLIIISLVLAFATLASSTEAQRYSVIKKIKGKYDFELRHYMPSLVASTPLTEQDDAFKQLANYIGVFTKPQNVDPKTQQPVKIAMTKPVIFRGGAMHFVLPQSKYLNIEDVPKPLNPKVKINQLNDGYVLSYTFGGRWSMEYVNTQKDALIAYLAAEHPDMQIDQASWSFLAYNSPMTPFFLKRNEISFIVTSIKPMLEEENTEAQRYSVIKTIKGDFDFEMRHYMPSVVASSEIGQRY